MEYIELTRDNIDDNHICCALGTKQYEDAVNEKKSWLKDRMIDGLVFYRLNERAKVFIEYLPAEEAWVPVSAPLLCLLIVFGSQVNIRITDMRNIC